MAKRNRQPRALSIHPRVVAGSTLHQKVNTCGKRRQAAPTEAHRRHIAEHPRDSLSLAYAAKLSAA